MAVAAWAGAAVAMAAVAALLVAVAVSREAAWPAAVSTEVAWAVAVSMVAALAVAASMVEWPADSTIEVDSTIAMVVSAAVDFMIAIATSGAALASTRMTTTLTIIRMGMAITVRLQRCVL